MPRPRTTSKPPSAFGAALSLQDFYRRLVDHWVAAVERDIVSHWHRNTRAHGPGGLRLDSSWLRERMRILEREIDASTAEHVIEPQVNLVAERVDKKSRDFFDRALPIVSVRPYLGHRAVDHFRHTNVSKIKSLGGKQITEIRNLLEEAETSGMRVEDLRKRIQDLFEVSRAKAELLARDQTLKLAGQITKARQEQAGISEYKWSTSHDVRVRPYHARLDGKIFSWDDPPVISPDGRRGHPGDDYQCRCVAIPVLPKIG